MVTTHDSLMRAIMTLYGNEGAARAIEEMKRDARTTGADDASTESFQTSTLGDDADAQSAPTVRLVNSIIERAATERASDIHLEPREIDPACAHAHRRRAAHDPHGAEGAAGFGHLAFEDHGRYEHLGAPRASGRPRKHPLEEAGHRPAHQHAAHHPRRDGGHPPCWTRARRCSTRRASAWRATTWRSTSGSSARTTAWC